MCQTTTALLTVGVLVTLSVLPFCLTSTEVTSSVRVRFLVTVNDTWDPE